MPETTSEMTREDRIRRREERRQRRRKRLENSLSSQTMAIVYLLILVLAVLLLVIPRSKVSTIEKRDLATLPKFSIGTLLSGEFTRGLQNYYDDTVPFRDSFKNTNNSMKNLFGIRSEATAEIVGNVAKVNETPSAATEATAPAADTVQETAAGTASSGTQPAASETPADAGTAADTGMAADAGTAGDAGTSAPADTQSAAAPAETKNYEKGEADGTFNNGFLIVQMKGHWRGLPLFAGGDYTEYTDFMNQLASATGGNVRVYAMPIPLASEYYLPSNFSDYSISQRDAIEEIMSMLSGSVTGINLVDVLDEESPLDAVQLRAADADCNDRAALRDVMAILYYFGLETIGEEPDWDVALALLNA